MAKKKKKFSKVIALLAVVFGLCMPTLAYCLSYDAQDYLCSNKLIALLVKPTTEYLVPSNLDDLLVGHIQKDQIVPAKLLWTAYVLDSHVQLIHSNIQIKATENNLEPPEHLTSFLMFHALNRQSDFFL